LALFPAEITEENMSHVMELSSMKIFLMYHIITNKLSLIGIVHFFLLRRTEFLGCSRITPKDRKEFSQHF